MNNIKTVKVISQLTGLEVGDILTRKDNQSPFELLVETCTETYSAKRYIVLSEELLNHDEFKAIEWFVEKPLTNRQRIEKLEGQLKDAEEKMEQGQKNYTAVLNENEKLLALLTKIDKRIQYKRDEFSKKVQELDKELADKILCGERIEWADEALTVYVNMLELLDKIVE